MFDAYGRNIHYLRLSVTDLCNLRCRYCMPDGVPKLAHEDILTYEEFLRLAALFAQCGIDTVRITGGEPLVRRGVEQLTAGLKAIPGIRRVALTTNGVLLAQKLPALLAAGLDNVNISLDTLHPETFRRITGKDELAAVQNGIRAALASGIPVKLNCVPQPGVNEGELESLAALAQEHPLQVRFIEMMPIGFGAGLPCLRRTAGALLPPLAAAAAGDRCGLWQWAGGVLFCARLARQHRVDRCRARQILRFLQPGAADKSGLSASVPCQRIRHRPARSAAQRRGRRGPFAGHSKHDSGKTPGTSLRPRLHARHTRDVPDRRITQIYG